LPAILVFSATGKPPARCRRYQNRNGLSPASYKSKTDGVKLNKSIKDVVAETLSLFPESNPASEVNWRLIMKELLA
jgi:hypothetical protein